MIYAQMQADLFEKARREMEANLRTEKLKANYYGSANHCNQNGNGAWQGRGGSADMHGDRDQMHYFAMAEQQINQLAARQTKHYIRDLRQDSSSPSSSSNP